MSVCLSKGLGAPVGSLMLGTADADRRGAGVAQAARCAGCGRSASWPPPGCYALDHHVERLADDHAHARLLAEACGVDPATVDTNIVVLSTSGRRRPSSPQQRPRACWSSAVGPTTVRMVTHLDVSTEQARRAAGILARL